VSTIVWVDDELDRFPCLDGWALQEGWDVESCFDLAQGRSALSRLRESKLVPQLILLDVILPVANTESSSDDGGSRFEPRYTGLALVREFPEFQDRMIIVSLVEHEKLVHAGLPISIAFFRKLELGVRAKAFRALVSRFMGKAEPAGGGTS
jgi:CheY-like chemotaxis protein